MAALPWRRAKIKSQLQSCRFVYGTVQKTFWELPAVFRVPARHLMLILLMTLDSMRSLGEPVARPLTVADAIETTRFMRSARGQESRGDGVFVSPDGKRYVIMLIRDDLKRRCNWGPRDGSSATRSCA
jgi:hypothetical protein